MRRLRDFIRSVFRVVPDSPGAASRAAMGAGCAAVPEFGVPGRRTVVVDGFKVELDLSTQVLGIRSVIELDSPETPLIATLGTVGSTGIVSASVLAQKAKIFDDGLYAAIEVAAQQGAGRHAGKASLLASLGGALAGADPSVAATAQELILGAARLGQVAIDGVPLAVETRAQRFVKAFLQNELRSKPIGFYTWSRQLESIFQQDRMLQGELDPASIKVLARALRADPSARAIYETHLRLISRLTNPLATPDLRTLLNKEEPIDADAVDEETRFFPPSVAHETELVKRISAERRLPNDLVLIDAMIRRIRSRKLDLAPRTESGWYDYQTWALEPLVVPERMPEAERLSLDGDYVKHLHELFKGLLTLSRETHIKQLEIPIGGMFPPEVEVGIQLDISPALSAEPLVTFYLRRALGYRFLRGVLEDAFGPGQLERLHRLTETGSVPTCLAEELDDMEALFLGAHVVVSKELGLAPDPVVGSEVSAIKAADRFTSWVRQLNSDSDLSKDMRTMVPVFTDRETGKVKIWAFLGWSRRPIWVEFARAPKATILDLNDRPPNECVNVRWDDLSAELPYPVTAELYVDRLLNRDEFRRLCDACSTRSEILRRLGVGETPA